MKRLLEKYNSEKPLVWLFYGDSITHGLYHTFGFRDFTELFEERIRGEIGRVHDIVINSAISGNTTQDLLDSFEGRVSRFSPDVMFLMIGMNDCCTERELPVDEYASNLKELVGKVEEIGTTVVLQTTCPILPGTAESREGNFGAYMGAVRDIAEQENLILIDHENYWKENADKHYFWMSNGFHPNEYGHRAFAKKIFEDMGIFDSESNTCKLYIP